MEKNKNPLQPKLDPTKSLYDQSRDTVGKIYRDANLNNHEDFIEVGDMTRELSYSLVDDVNDAIKNYDKKGKPYYLMVHEKKDLQMKTALLRRLLYFGYRPWPEDDTIVFWKNPKTQDLRFCWCLPHWSEMHNILANPDGYDKDYLHHIKSWRDYDLRPFGFVEDKKEGWIPNPRWRFKRIDEFGKNKKGQTNS